MVLNESEPLCRNNDHRLLAGDAVAGKARIPEVALEVIGDGYTAIYYLNSTGQYTMATSLLRQSDGSISADVYMPSTTWLESLRHSKLWTVKPETAAFTKSQIGSRKMYLSAQVLSAFVMGFRRIFL